MDSLGSVLNRISTIDMNARRFGLEWTSPPEGAYQAPVAPQDDGAGESAAAVSGTQAAATSAAAGSFAQTLQAAHSTSQAAHSTSQAAPATHVPTRSPAAVTTPTSTSAHAGAAPVTHAATPAPKIRASGSVVATTPATRAPAVVAAKPASVTDASTTPRVSASTPATTTTTSAAVAKPAQATVSTSETIVPTYYPTNLGTQPSVHSADVGTYTPAMELAQWQEIAKTGTYLPNASGPGLSILPGTPRYPAPQSTIDAGLAQAKARCQAAAITDAQVQSAADALTQQLAAGNYAAAGGPGYTDVSAQAGAAANYDSGWYQSADAKNQLAQMIASYDQAAARRTDNGITEAEPAEVGLARASY